MIEKYKFILHDGSTFTVDSTEGKILDIIYAISISDRPNKFICLNINTVNGVKPKYVNARYIIGIYKEKETEE